MPRKPEDKPTVTLADALWGWQVPAGRHGALMPIGMVDLPDEAADADPWGGRMLHKDMEQAYPGLPPEQQPPKGA